MNMQHAILEKQRGLSIVELMVAITISLILLTGVAQIFLSSKASYTTLEATSRVQENGRFAIGFLTDDVRMAGFLGCNRQSVIEKVINDDTNFKWNFVTGIEGNEATGGTWTPTLNALIAGQVKNGTDVLVIRGLANDGVNLSAPSTPTQLTAVNAGNITDGDIMVVSDCARSTIFQVTGHAVAGDNVTIAHAGGGAWVPGNTADSFTDNSFNSDAQVGRLVTNVYYIGTGASGAPALFRQSTVVSGTNSTMQAQELVDGVENMQILYGVDSNGDGIANRYVTANNATMANVVSVRISLLLRSDNNVLSTAQTYSYDGTNIVSTDRRLRRVFNTTIKIRNRGVL